MKRSNRLILLIGILLAAVAFVGIVLLLGNGPSTNDRTARNETTIVKASADIPLGTTVTEDLVESETVPLESAPAGAYKLESEVIGQVTTTVITKGQIATPTAWFSTTTTDAGAITRNLATGRRAMSVQVDQVSGVGTLIKPGDRVDVVVGIAGADKFPVVTTDPQTDQVSVVPGLNATSVKAIIQNLEVVGTLLPPPPNDQNADNQETEGQAPALNGQAQIVILAVTAQEAEVLRFGQIDGSITLVLRSPEDKEAPAEDTTGITLRELVDNWAVIPPQVVETVLPGQ